MEQNTFKINYQDLLWMPALLLIMRAFDILIVYPDALFTQRFFRILLEDFITTSLCWLVMRRYILWLDQVFPFVKGITIRIALQVPAAVVLNCLLLLLINELVHHFYYGYPPSRVVYTHHIWVYAVWSLVQNAIYIGIYLVSWSGSLISTKVREGNLLSISPKSFQLMVKLGNKRTYVALEDIVYCSVSESFTTICTKAKEVFPIDKSLDELGMLLPKSDYFRVNRQFIIRRDLVQAIEKLEQGKARLLLKPDTDLPDFIPISRTKAPALKKWLQVSSA